MDGLQQHRKMCEKNFLTYERRRQLVSEAEQQLMEKCLDLSNGKSTVYSRNGKQYIKPWRNNYFVYPNREDKEVVLSLSERGLMRISTPVFAPGALQCELTRFGINVLSVLKNVRIHYAHLFGDIDASLDVVKVLEETTTPRSVKSIAEQTGMSSHDVQKALRVMQAEGKAEYVRSGWIICK